MDSMPSEVNSMTLATFVSTVGGYTIYISCTGTTGKSTGATIMAGQTARGVMDGTGERSVTGYGRRMATDTVDRVTCTTAINDH